MMRAARPIVAAPVGLLLLATTLSGQTAEPVTVADLRPPSTPAFVLLGVEPSSVTRPSSPRALAGWAFSQVSESSLIPRNIALEVTPYWLVSRPAFTFDDYFSEPIGGQRDILGTLATTVARSFALSTASAPRGVGTDTATTGLAFGASTLVWPGRAPRGLMDQRRRLEAALGACAAVDDPLACYRETEALRDSIRTGIREPVGFVMQMSGGFSLDSPADDPGSARWRRAGVWISPAYRTEGRLDLILVGRYQRDRGETAETGTSELYDAGMRLSWRPSSAIALSAEALQRWVRGGPENTTIPRWGGLVEYRAREDMFVFYSFGRDFESPDREASPLFSSLGLSVGAGRKPAVSIPGAGVSPE
jgi:hypothetical protein